MAPRTPELLEPSRRESSDPSTIEKTRKRTRKQPNHGERGPQPPQTVLKDIEELLPEMWIG